MFSNKKPSASCGKSSPGVVGHRYTRDPQKYRLLLFIALAQPELDGKTLLLKVTHWPQDMENQVDADQEAVPPTPPPTHSYYA